jgi:hypothetical protein
MHRMFTLAGIGFVLVLFGGAAAFAQIESTPIPMPAKPDFGSMKFMVGTWNCTATNTRRSKPYTSTATTTMDPSGYWMTTKTVAHPVSFDPTPTITVDKVTYDAGSKQWVDVSTDDRGTYAIATSPGWNGNKIVWHPVNVTSVTSGNVVGGGDTTTTKLSDSKTMSVGTFKESGGRTVTFKSPCTKS